MKPNSLRFRLLLAFLVLVALILFVGLASFVLNQRARSQVADLRARGVLDLRSIDLTHVGIEAEGVWNPEGGFLATDVEVIPTVQRPRLRGEIQAIDTTARTITLYGLTLHVPEDVELANEDADLDLSSLAVRQRVEVFCSVEEGRWEVAKLQRLGVKSSDKIKGTPTGSDLDGEAPETLEIHGLLIVVEPIVAGGAESALGDLRNATQILLAVQECRSAANDLVRGSVAAPADALATATARLQRSGDELHGAIAASVVADDDPRVARPASSMGALRMLARRVTELDARIASLVRLVRSDPAQASVELEASFEPYLQETLLPLVYAYLGQAEEDLGDELRQVLDHATATTRVALATSVVAVIAAFVLGFLVWRSIERPIHALHEAAVQLGRGRLDTRVELRSHDEFGVLATAMNRMAGELAKSTVSIESMERVQERLRQSLAEKELLLRELHHRVKNNMQVISSLLAMQTDEGHPGVARVLQQSQDRIRSIALIHEQLYRSSELASVDVAAYFESLSTHLLQSFGKAGLVKVAVDAEPIVLDIDQSMACGLIVNELVTNSLKHAYPPGRAGTIRIALRRGDGGEAVLEVLDDGPGLAGWNPRQTRTLGASLVEMLARQLRGRVELPGGREGACVRVVFPLHQAVVA